jgi:hypothetical protein
MARQFRSEVADVSFIDTIRRRNVRSEVTLRHVDVIEYKPRMSRVRVAGDVAIYSLMQYEGRPIDLRHFDVEVVLSVVPRDPERRINGLEVVRFKTVATDGATE